MSNVRFRIKIGIVEVEVEGEQQFVEEKFPALLMRVMDENGWGDDVETLKPAAEVAAPTASAANKPSFDHSTNTIASIIDARTGPDLACAHLSIVKGEIKFTRKEILDEMQSAAAYYNHNYSGNLTKILQSLMKAKKLNLVSSHTYSLPKSQVDHFEAELEKE